MTNPVPDYGYDSADAADAASYLWPRLRKIIESLDLRECNVFEIGSGNGAIAAEIERIGLTVTGIDPSETGVFQASVTASRNSFFVRSIDDDLSLEFGKFPLVLSLEVLEHCYSPARFMRVGTELLEDEGYLIISTPFHGYIKNLALAIFNRFDFHWSPLWEGGHIKFWSIRSLSELLETNGFEVLKFHRVGRIPPLAKSMIVVARKKLDTS